MTTHHPARRLMDLMTGYWNTQALNVAAELGLADRIADGRRGCAELAAEAGAHPDALRRLLAFLVGAGVLEGDDEKGYALTELGRLLRTDVPGSMHDYARIYGEAFYDAWRQLGHSIRTGESGFRRVFGKELFAHLDDDPELSLTYDRAMVAGTAFFSDIPGRIDFSRTQTVVDIAGGHGALLAEILRAEPGLRGVLFDAPHVIAEARESNVAAELAERVEYIGGDFFEAVPPGGDVYVLSRILHSFDDESCVRILTNCATAMRAGTRLLIVERLIPANGRPGLALGYDLHMLAVTGGGRERTEREFADLLQRTGFALAASHELSLDVHVLETTRQG